MNQLRSNTPLIQEVSQFEVDFVIPRMGKDLPLGIDPFLLFKSRDSRFQSLHSLILNTFNLGIQAVRDQNLSEARRLLEFPEVPEIGLGYTQKGKQGAGIGNFLTELLIETLIESKPLLDRGVHHIEEMQLVSVGIGPDRISDIAANILKEYFINYTQEQCQLWKIPLQSGVPVNHIFDPKTKGWYDGYFDLPVSPYDSSPIIFVPRRIVRTLPWINYDDFFKMEFASYLRAKKVRGRLQRKNITQIERSFLDKDEVIQIARKEIERVERFVKMKESSAASVRPSSGYISIDAICPEAEILKSRLKPLAEGAKFAAQYQKLVLEVLNFLFVPDLIDGQLEARTIDGTERRDIIFTNDSDESFWEYIRNSIVVFWKYDGKSSRHSKGLLLGK